MQKQILIYIYTHPYIHISLSYSWKTDDRNGIFQKSNKV